jgi:hypothetical protein
MRMLQESSRFGKPLRRPRSGLHVITTAVLPRATPAYKRGTTKLVCIIKTHDEPEFAGLETAASLTPPPLL